MHLHDNNDEGGEGAGEDDAPRTSADSDRSYAASHHDSMLLSPHAQRARAQFRASSKKVYMVGSEQQPPSFALPRVVWLKELEFVPSPVSRRQTHTDAYVSSTLLGEQRRTSLALALYTFQEGTCGLSGFAGAEGYSDDEDNDREGD